MVFTLSLKQLWASRKMIEHPPVKNCGFVYSCVDESNWIGCIDSALIGSQPLVAQSSDLLLDFINKAVNIL